MEKISTFRFNDPQKTKADKVELLINEYCIYIVKWKWSTSNRYFEEKYITYNEALKRYTERVNFLLRLKNNTQQKYQEIDGLWMAVDSAHQTPPTLADNL